MPYSHMELLAARYLPDNLLPVTTDQAFTFVHPALATLEPRMSTAPTSVDVAAQAEAAV